MWSGYGRSGRVHHVRCKYDLIHSQEKTIATSLHSSPPPKLRFSALRPFSAWRAADPIPRSPYMWTRTSSKSSHRGDGHTHCAPPSTKRERPIGVRLDSPEIYCVCPNSALISREAHRCFLARGGVVRLASAHHGEGEAAVGEGVGSPHLPSGKWGRHGLACPPHEVDGTGGGGAPHDG